MRRWKMLLCDATKSLNARTWSVPHTPNYLTSMFISIICICGCSWAWLNYLNLYWNYFFRLNEQRKFHRTARESSIPEASKVKILPCQHFSAVLLLSEWNRCQDNVASSLGIGFIALDKIYESTTTP